MDEKETGGGDKQSKECGGGKTVMQLCTVEPRQKIGSVFDFRLPILDTFLFVMDFLHLSPFFFQRELFLCRNFPCEHTKITNAAEKADDERGARR